jgi:cell wall-associated NlpC family hydrolase
VADELRASTALIEQLLGDPALRASFRADPAAVLRGHGLGELAEGLPAGERALVTLELRESRSSLAGVIVAAAAEGVDFTHVAEHAAPRLGRDAGRAIAQLVKRLSPHHSAPRSAPAPRPHHRLHHVQPPRIAPAQALPSMARPAPVRHDVAEPAATTEPAPTEHRVAAHHAPEPVDTLAAHTDPLAYPGDDASSAQIAAWMGANAQRVGLPPELPVMAALTESGLRNLDYGDRDSLGFFQMRSSIWDRGAYAGYPSDPQLQIEWFINEALAVRQSDSSLAGSPSSWGEWVADVERPAAEYRYRYQLQLSEAQELLRASGLHDTGAGTSYLDAGTTTDPGAAGEAVAHVTPVSLGRAVTSTANACDGNRCAAGGGDARAGLNGAGLVRYAYARHGVQLPSTVAQQFDVGAAVPRAELAPGDAVFFGSSRVDVQDVGIYVGDGRVITAGAHQHTVSIGSLQSGTLQYLGARRYSDRVLTAASSYARTLPTVKR